MKVAVQLSPNNRYVIRCATRLFSHYGEIERAQHILRHNDFIKKDPWLLSADIAVATMQGRMSPFLKKGIELVYHRIIIIYSNGLPLKWRNKEKQENVCQSSYFSK